MGRLSFMSGAALAIGLALAPGVALGQSRERSVSVTGPGGRTIERSASSVRGPGYVDRQVSVSRPGATVQRGVSAVRPPAFVGGPSYGHRGGGYAPWPPRPIIVNQRGPSQAGAFGIGAGVGALVGTGAGLLLGSALSKPPPPPVFVSPAPVVMAPIGPPNVVVAPPVRYQSPGTVVIDPVAMAVDRLGSNHANSRIEGAVTLGRLGDSRAIPALVDRLKNDKSKDVRVASATALGEIGDPSAGIYLERVITYDKKQDVRDAAASALARLPREVIAPAAAATPLPSPRVEEAYPSVSRTNPPPSPDPGPDIEPLPDPDAPVTDYREFRPINRDPVERVPPLPTPAPRSPGP